MLKIIHKTRKNKGFKYIKTRLGKTNSRVNIIKIIMLKKYQTSVIISVFLKNLKFIYFFK